MTNAQYIMTLLTDRDLAEYCDKIGREHIISITSCYGENYGEHFFTVVYDTPDLVLADI